MPVSLATRVRRAVPATQLSALAALTASAEPVGSPAGLWETVDDRTGAARSLVRIDSDGNTWHWLETRSLDRRDGPEATCTRCPGACKDQPIVRMAILTGLKPSAGDRRLWEGGEILDPGSCAFTGLARACTRMGARSKCAASSAFCCSGAPRSASGRSDR